MSKDKKTPKSLSKSPAKKSAKKPPVAISDTNRWSEAGLQARATELLDVLQLEKIEENLYRGANETPALPGYNRLFGGQVLSQALQAAYHTVPMLNIHSLHGYFLRAGSAKLPVLYEVDRIRDGRSFTTRRVVAIQRGQAIFSMSASFQKDEGGMEHADPMPNVPPPEELEDDVEVARRFTADDEQVAGLLSPMAGKPRPFYTRSVFPIGSDAWRAPRRWNPVWIKFRVPLPATDGARDTSGEPSADLTMRLRHVLLAYASDMGLVSTASLPHNSDLPRNRLQMASLDHAIWLHRPILNDDWLLLHKHTSAAAGSRGLAHAEFYTREGLLVASVTQEGLLREVVPPSER